MIKLAFIPFVTQRHTVDILPRALLIIDYLVISLLSTIIMCFFQYTQEGWTEFHAIRYSTPHSRNAIA